MELTMQERKKLTMVKAQAYLKAGKTKKSVMLDATSVNRLDTAGDMRPVSCTWQDSGTSWETVSSWLIPRSISTGTVLPGTALWSNRHSSPSGQPARSWVLSIWQEACSSLWRTSSPMDISMSMMRHEGSSSR